VYTQTIPVGCSIFAYLSSPVMLPPQLLSQPVSIVHQIQHNHDCSDASEWQTRMYADRVCARTQRTGAAARESLRRDRPGGLTSPALHACGSASPFRARCCHRNQRQVVSAPLMMH
jgi:hypothetical protein